MRLAVQNLFTAGNQFSLIKLCLAESEILDRPSGDLGEAGFSATCQPEGSAHERARAVAKARRIASLPLPSARSPAPACTKPSRRPFRIPASCASSCSSSLRPARIASLSNSANEPGGQPVRQHVDDGADEREDSDFYNLAEDGVAHDPRIRLAEGFFHFGFIVSVPGRLSRTRKN